MKFKEGERVVLVQEYFVYSEGDCKMDSNVRKLTVGSSIGTFERLDEDDHREDLAMVTWDDVSTSYPLRVNIACLGAELTEAEVDQALASIALSWKAARSNE